MTRRSRGILSVPVVALAAAGLAMTGCGGGGGGGGGPGGGAAGVLVATSFTGFATQVSQGGPNTGVPLPAVFLDEALEFTFDGPISTAIFGGLYTVPVLASITPQELQQLEQTLGLPANCHLELPPGAGGQGTVEARLVCVGVGPTTAVGGVAYYPFALQGVASSSLQIRENTLGGPMLFSYQLGIHRDKPNTIVVDPVVDTANPFGLSPNLGFTEFTEYVYRIPQNNGIVVGSSPAQPLGIDPLQLPITTPAFTPQPNLSMMFVTRNSTGPDPIPPTVVAIEAVSNNTVVSTCSSLQNGVGSDPIPHDAIIRVTFNKAVDGGSLNSLVNFVVTNVDLGRLVPGTLVRNPSPGGIPLGANVVEFTPTPSYGPGMSPTQGYQIGVQVGDGSTDPNTNITGLPQGINEERLPMSPPMNTCTFTTIPCDPATTPNCVAAFAEIEDFDDNGQEDTSFTPQFHACEWNGANNPGELVGIAISGNPLATFLGLTVTNPNALGTRFQVTITFPGPLSTNPAGLFSPFDDANPPVGGGFNLSCPVPPCTSGSTVNPNGGSHIMHLYETVDVGSPRDSLELIEWGPVNNFVVQTSYPMYQAWCGMTSITGPIACGTGNGLSTVYRANYNVVTPQPFDPNNQSIVNPNAGGVLVSSTQTYQAGPGFTSYFPFPIFSPPFDYLGSGASSGNLIVEQNIEPGQQVANFNRYRAIANTPVRRIIGAPLSSGASNSAGAGCDTYDQRFTFLAMMSSCQSAFYDTGVADPQYVSLQLTPRPQDQPAGTEVLWEFEGADATLGPTTPSGPTTGFMAFYSGSPATGTESPEILLNPNPVTQGPGLSDNQYFRFRVTMRNDNLTNSRQRYSSVIMAFTTN